MTDDARRIPLLMGVLFGLTGLGSASAAVVLPLLGRDLGIGVGHTSWTISLYALMLAVATPVYGRMSDLVGVRGPLLVGVCLMSLGALLAAARRRTPCCSRLCPPSPYSCCCPASKGTHP